MKKRGSLEDVLSQFPDFDEFMQKGVPVKTQKPVPVADEDECSNLARAAAFAFDPACENGVFNLSRVGSKRAFLHDFLNDDLRRDMPCIAREYLARLGSDFFRSSHNVPRLSGASGEDFYASGAVYGAVFDHLMDEAFRDLNSYAAKLLRYLIKTYHKKEYNALKRFSSLSLSDVFSLCDIRRSEKVLSSGPRIGFVLTAAEIFGKEVSPLCAPLYHFLNGVSDEMEKEIEDAREHSEIFSESFFEELAGADISQGEIERATRVFHKAERFVEAAETWHGFTGNYVKVFGQGMDFATTKTLLKRAYPERAFSPSEIALYAWIESLVLLIGQMMDDVGAVASPLILGTELFYGDVEPVLFKPEAVEGFQAESSGPVKGEEEKREVPFTPVASAPEAEELRMRLLAAEKEIRALKEEAAGKARLVRELSATREELANARAEAAALRAFAYNSAAGDEGQAENGISLESARSFLASKRIAVIGGHPNWVSKLKNEMGDRWKFVKPAQSGTVDVAFVTGMDFVFFFTDTISHATYGKYVKACREHGVRFGYLHGVNVLGTISQAYAAMNSAK
jgi:hypothetical protein